MAGSDNEDDGGGKLPAAFRADPSAKTYIYRDFSNLPDDPDSDDSPPPKRGNSESSIRVQKFPVKLYAILAQKEFNDIVTWMPHGRAWKVLKPNLFESLVMPLFFEYSNYHSFNRLVNAWSFRRISSGPDRGAYYHELFLRGKPHLQKYMRRLPKTHKKLAMKKEDEPDFYAMDKSSPLPPLGEVPGVNMLGTRAREQALARAAAISDPAMAAASDPAMAARLGGSTSGAGTGAAAGYTDALLARQAGFLEGEQAALARLRALDPSIAAALAGGSGPLPSSSSAAAASSTGDRASLPSSAAASLPSLESLRGRSSLGVPLPGAALSGAAGLPPQGDLPPLDAADPSSPQSYQYQRMRHLQHLQMFQRQMGPEGAARAPPTEEEQLELLRRLNAQGGGAPGAAGRGRPPYM